MGCRGAVFRICDLYRDFVEGISVGVGVSRPGLCCAGG
jgi:hypothetical protein